jgi:hypothetical protein
MSVSKIERKWRKQQDNHEHLGERRFHSIPDSSPFAIGIISS